MDNPLLDRAAAPEHVKPRLLGHFGTVPGLNLVHAHANRLILRRDLDGASSSPVPATAVPGPNACAWLEGTYSELYSHVPQRRRGDGARCSGSSRSPAACRATAPGDARLLPRGRRARLLPAARVRRRARQPGPASSFCVVGDGEAETGPLATSWHCNTFVDPARDGAVLPILHLNGYKIANPTLLARIPEERAAAS